MEVQLYRAGKVTTTREKQFQGRLNRARQVATISSDADWQSAIEQLEREMHQVTPAKCNLFDKLSQHDQRQLLQQVATKAAGLRRIFAKILAQTKTAAEHEGYGVANMTADNRVAFQVHLTDDQTKATTWSIADTDRVANQLEWEIYGITSNGQMRFKKELSIRMIAFGSWWKAIGVQELAKTIEQCVIHSGYPKMHLVSHISESIRQMGSGNNITTDISDQLHISNVNGASQSTTKVNCILQMLKHNDRSTGLDYMEETVSHLPFKAGTRLAPQMFSPYYPLPINSEILVEHIFYASSIVRMSHFSAPYHNRYIIWDKPVSAECAESSK